MVGNNINLEQMSDEELDALEASLAQPTQQQRGSNDLSQLSDEELDALEASLGEPQDETSQLLNKADELDQQIKTANKKEYSALQSGLMGTINGVSLGGADEIGGAIKTAYDVATGDASFSQITEQFEQNRKSLSNEFKRAESDNPEAFLAGDVAGGVGTIFIPGLNIAKGVKGASTLAAASGFLRSEQDIVGRVTDAVIMGAFGGAAAVGGNFVSKGMGSAANVVGKRAAASAQKYNRQMLAKSLGFTDETSAANLDLIFKNKGLAGIEAVSDVAEELGLKASPAQGGFIIPSPEALKSRIDFSKKSYGGVLQDVFDQVDISAGGPSVNPIMLINKVRNEGRIARNLKSDVGYVVSETKQFLDEIVTPLQDESMWTVNRLWNYRSNLRQSIQKRALDSEGLIKKDLTEKLNMDLGDILEGIIEGASGDSINKQLFREASSKYAKLSTLESILNENAQTAASGTLGGLKRSMQIAPLINAKSIAGGAFGGAPGFIAANVLDAFLKTPSASLIETKALSKVAALLVKNNRFATTLIDAAGRSEMAFQKVLSSGEATYDFTQKPLARSSDEVLQKLPKVLAMLDIENPEVSAMLRDAASKNDRDLIGGIMSQLALSSQGAQFIQVGIGWDGKALLEGDIKTVESMIKSASMSSTKKAQLMQKFKQDKMIPELQGEEEKPFFKVYDPNLKTKVMR